MTQISNNNWLAMSDGALETTNGVFIKHQRLV